MRFKFYATLPTKTQLHVKLAAHQRPVIYMYIY